MEEELQYHLEQAIGRSLHTRGRLVHPGDQELGRRGRGLAGVMRHQVGDGGVDLVSDGGDDGHGATGDGHREILLCEAILKSHQDGGWVKVKGAKQ